MLKDLSAFAVLLSLFYSNAHYQPNKMFLDRKSDCTIPMLLNVHVDCKVCPDFRNKCVTEKSLFNNQGNINHGYVMITLAR